MRVDKLNIVLARKPLSEKSIAENVLKHGTGGINIDGSRIGINGLDLIERQKQEKSRRLDNNSHNKGFLGSSKIFPNENVEQGRFPANIIFDEEAGQLLDEQSGIGKSSKSKKQYENELYGYIAVNYGGGQRNPNSTYDDKGGASRFFYCPKDEDENNELKNNNMNIDLRLGDCLEVLKTLKDNSVDAIVCDPPYGLAFMNKKWDYDVPSKEIWTECLRVLKPGGHMLSFGGSRTYHRMAVSVEDAGFEIRDQIIFVYGSGFPKSHNIGKAIDKIEGNEREVVGTKERKDFKNYDGSMMNVDNRGKHIKIDVEETKGNSEWEGWGTALKPAHEDIVLAKKDGEDLMDVDTQPGFFYGSKANKKDRNEGLTGITNQHPTVKNVELMKYLIKLITPPNGVVLDPFMGSGSTGKAAVQLGHSFIGIEREKEYFDIAQARINHEKSKPVQGKLL